MTHMQRNQSDLPLTVSEATEFLSPEEQSDAGKGLTAIQLISKKGKSSEDAIVDGSNGEAAGPPAREQWASKFEFIFSCIAFSIGLGNVSLAISRVACDEERSIASPCLYPPLLLLQS